VTTIHHGLEVGVAGLGSGPADKTQAAPGQAAQTQTPAQPGTAGQTDEVEITSTAQLLASLEQQIAAVPDVDQSRVDTIQQVLGNGTYQVDAPRVADGLLNAQKFDAQATAAPVSGPKSDIARAFAATAKLGSETGR
jgi:negative regulator of flagellin synthesis FlgM